MYELKSMVEELRRESKNVDLSTNMSKTKIMANLEIERVELEEKEIKWVSEYKYLGQTVAFNEWGKLELRARTAKA